MFFLREIRQRFSEVADARSPDRAAIPSSGLLIRGSENEGGFGLLSIE
jgi:hypothetical protein